MITKPLKPKLCKICKEKFTPERPLQSVCGFGCAIEQANKKKIALERTERYLERKKTREAIQRIKPRYKLLSEAQAVFNRYIRMRDEKLPCISCQRFHQGQWHAGHYRTIGAAPELRFNEDNCHKQCAPCNNHLSGNLVAYRQNLIKKVGISRLQFLEGDHEPLKLTIEDIKAIKAKYSALCKQLEKENKCE